MDAHIYPYEEMFLAGLNHEDIGHLLGRDAQGVYTYLYTRGYRPKNGRPQRRGLHRIRQRQAQQATRARAKRLAALAQGGTDPDGYYRTLARLTS